MRQLATVAKSSNSDVLPAICTIQLSRSLEFIWWGIRTNTFCNFYKYDLQFGKIWFVIGTKRLLRRRKAAWNLSLVRLHQKGPIAFDQASKMPICNRLYEFVCIWLVAVFKRFLLKLFHFLLEANFLPAKVQQDKKFLWPSIVRPGNPHAWVCMFCVCMCVYATT